MLEFLDYQAPGRCPFYGHCWRGCLRWCSLCPYKSNRMGSKQRASNLYRSCERNGCSISIQIDLDRTSHSWRRLIGSWKGDQLVFFDLRNSKDPTRNWKKGIWMVCSLCSGCIPSCTLTLMEQLALSWWQLIEAWLLIHNPSSILWKRWKVLKLLRIL